MPTAQAHWGREPGSEEAHNLSEREPMTQVTISTLTTIVGRERERRPGKVIAFVAVTRDTRNDCPFQIGVAILGEHGYALPHVPMLHNSYESASAMALTLNNLLGISDDTATAIAADTMHRSRLIQEEREQLVTLKMTREEALEVHAALDFAGECEDVADRIQDALRA